MRLKPALLTALSCSLALAQPASSPLRPPITGYSHIGLIEANGEAAGRFYADQFGWPLIQEKKSDGVARYFVSADQYIELLPPPENFDSAKSVVDHIAFTTPDAEGIRRYLKSMGVAVPAKVTAEGKGRYSLMVRDFEGNKIEFVQGGSPRGAHNPAAAPPISTHIIHMGLATRDDADMRRFYIDILGFHQFWKGWRVPGKVSWDQVQVPDGTDWLEFMLGLPPDGTTAQLRLADHYAPGMKDVDVALNLLRSREMTVPEHKVMSPMLDGRPKWSTHDPSGTRVELMEFKPIQDPCCTPYTGGQPDR